jgi:predicted metal-binding membrane protein
MRVGAAAFLAMWVAMTALMMAPSLAPMLWRYARAVDGAGGVRRASLTTLVGTGYLGVWTVLGAVAFPLGIAPSHAAPLAAGVVVALAGAWQLTPWKAHHLACCRRALAPARAPRADAVSAWRHGLRLGLECARCCGNLMVVSLALGVMNVRAMAVVGAAIAAERLAPAGVRVARAIGAIVVGAGIYLVARASGLGS